MERQQVDIRYQQLKEIVSQSLEDCTPHSKGFVCSILEVSKFPIVFEEWENQSLNQEARYGGYPSVANLGFLLKTQQLKQSEVAKEHFVDGLERLMKRAAEANTILAGDDVALLGIATGLSQLEEPIHTELVEQSKDWLSGLIRTGTRDALWTIQMQDLAKYLITEGHKLQPSINSDTDSMALELVLQYHWTNAFPGYGHDISFYRTLLRNILIEELPKVGDLERAGVLLRALEILVTDAVYRLLPMTDRGIDALQMLQHVKAKLDKSATRLTKLVLISIAIIWILLVGILGNLIAHLGWDRMEPVVYVGGLFTPVFLFIFLSLTGHRFGFTVLREFIILKIRKMLYELIDVDLERIEDLLR